MKRQSIQSYLFRNMFFTLLVIVVLFSIVNLIVRLGFEEEYIYHELEDAHLYKKDVVTLNGKKMIVHNYEILGDEINYVIKSHKKGGDSLIDEKVLEEIMVDYFKGQEEEGKLYYKSYVFYYYVTEKPNGYCLYVMGGERNGLGREVIGLSLVLLVAIFLVSRRISRYISKPIEKLSLYSQEIAKKNWQADLEPVNNEELSILAESLKQMKEDLQMAEMEERQFLQATSHDLKTPLMVIKGYAQALMDGMPIEGEAPEQVIMNETIRLERKVKQLIHLNTLAYALDHKKEKDEIQIDRILNRLIEKFKVVNPNLNFESQVINFSFQGDADALMIAFENILDNQVRYAKSQIKVTLRGNQLLMSNDGPHFDQDPESLFEIYKKGQAGQFGLGLAITKKVFDAHGINIKAFDKKEGVCFEITF